MLSSTENHNAPLLNKEKPNVAQPFSPFLSPKDKGNKQNQLEGKKKIKSDPPLFTSLISSALKKH